MRSPLVLSIDSSREQIERGAGNKGRFLFELQTRGIVVPAWAILVADAFARHRRDAGLDGFIAERLRGFQPAHAARVAEEISGAIQGAALGAELRDALREAVALVGDGRLAIRSSGAEEDSAAASFAGQFDSFLGVRGFDAVADRVKKCWASAYSERALLYRHQRGFGFSGIEIAVIVQRLIDAEVSGAAFTVNPTNGNPFELVVSAVYGLGEGLVSGAVDADVFTLDKHTGRKRRVHVGGKQQRFTVEGPLDVPADLRGAPCLDDAQLEAVHREALKIEAAFGAPQDLEWCFAGGALWILQARPVTGLAPIDTAQFDLWDNSNIVENYPGITGQLTFSFSRHLYARVFTEYCRLLRIPRRQLAEMEGFLGSLLGYANGRVYYNLLHWYRLVGVNPMQRLGRKMMEVQMGLSEPVDLEAVAERIRPYHADSRFDEAIIRLVSSLRFFWMFARSESYVRRFKTRFDRLFHEYDAIDYERLPPETVFHHYKRFENAILGIWGVTVSLESAIGLPYGILRMMARRWIPDAPAWFEVGVIGSVGEVESAQPARRIEELAALVRADDALIAAIRDTPSRDLPALVQRGYPELAAKIDDYLRAFGYRAVNELKLEEPDLRENPSLLFDLLKAALAVGPSPGASAAVSYEAEAQKLVDDTLTLPRRAAFHLVRSVVKDAIRRRETVRFCRSRAFGVFRRMFRAIGRGLAAQGVLDDPRDVFHLRREELDGCFDAGVSHRELKPLVAQRKRDLEAYTAMKELAPRFVSRGSIALWLKWLDAGAAPEEDAAAGEGDTGELRGTACSPGIAVGTAKVVQEPSQFDGGILVTYRTDPGWIAAFPSASALLIERGSPLTHAAIVARELGIPTIVQIPSLTKRVKTGMQLSVDGERGVVAVTSTPSAGAA